MQGGVVLQTWPLLNPALNDPWRPRCLLSLTQAMKAALVFTSSTHSVNVNALFKVAAPFYPRPPF